MKINQTSSLLVLFFLMCSAAFGQENFMDGYYIKPDGTEINCLIANKDWRSNPEKIKIKINGNEKEISINEISEFGINDYSKYKKFTTKIDQSSTQYGNLSNDRNPEWETKTVLLNTLLESEASLYEYFDKGVSKYFVEYGGELEQLIYKKYQQQAGNVQVNNTYQQQIKGYANCNKLTERDIQNIDYRKKDLIAAFRVINQCLEGTIIDYSEMRIQSKDLIKIRATTGASISSLVLEPASGNEINYDKKITGRIGIEFEYILPYNNGAWTIVLEPNYQYYKAEGDPLTTFRGSTERSIDYQSLVLPIGVRRNIQMTNYELFVNVFYSLDFDFGSKVGVANMEVEGRPAFALGGGIHKNKLGAELRFYLPREITGNQIFYDSKFRKTSIVISYQIF